MAKQIRTCAVRVYSMHAASWNPPRHQHLWCFLFRLVIWDLCFADWNIILSLFFFKPLSFLNSCSFLEMFLLLVHLIFLLTFYANNLWLQATAMWRRYRILRLLLGYCNYYTIHVSPYTPAYILIENTLVQHKMTKNSHMVLCYQNRVSKGTNQHYGLHSLANIAAHSASVTVLGLLKKKKKKKTKKKKELVQNGVLAVFRLAT